MEIVVDLAILIVVCCIAFLLLRTKLRVCPQCASVFVDRPASGVRQHQPLLPMQREPSPFLDITPPSEPGPFSDYPLPVDPNPSWDTPLAITESEDDFPVIETHEPLDTPALSTSPMMTPPEILESGEILIEPDTEETVDLLPTADQPQVDEDSGEELMLEEDIGIGPRGLPLASRLIDAGFGVTMTTQKWGRGGRRRKTQPENPE